VKPENRVEALRLFGYSTREASFLTTVVVHGGYFVARQYAQFIGRPTSLTAASHLTARLTAQQHATVVTYRRGGAKVYYVRSEKLYDAIDEADARDSTRRAHRGHRLSSLTIKTRLMTLDYVLSHPDDEFLATECERAEYVSSVCGADAATSFLELCPGPIAIRRGSEADGPHPSFVYLDAAGSSLAGFRTYLDHGRDLFRHLTAGFIIYASDSTALFETAETAFRRFCDDDGEICRRTAGERMAELLTYFGARHRYETKQMAGFTKATLDQFRDDRERFRGARFESAYARWAIAGDEGLREVVETDQSYLIRPDLQFETHWLNHSYAQCSTRSDIGSQNAGV
jgi:hypothetical protein